MKLVHNRVQFFVGSILLAFAGISIVHASDPPLHVSICEIGVGPGGPVAGTLDGQCSILGGSSGVGIDPNNGPRYKSSSLDCYAQFSDGLGPCDPYVCCVGGTGFFASIRLITPGTCEVYYRCVGICCDSGAVITALPMPPGCSLSVPPQGFACKVSP
jgi:hypothetical protein